MSIQPEEARGLSLDEATIQDFQASLCGQVILPDNADYDDARNVWNGMIDRRPALIARCAEAADVSIAGDFREVLHTLLDAAARNR